MKLENIDKAKELIIRRDKARADYRRLQDALECHWDVIKINIIGAKCSIDMPRTINNSWQILITALNALESEYVRCENELMDL